MMWMNFGRPHKSLADPYPRTPAMAAGVADHIWTCEEIAALLGLRNQRQGTIPNVLDILRVIWGIAIAPLLALPFVWPFYLLAFVLFAATGLGAQAIRIRSCGQTPEGPMRSPVKWALIWGTVGFAIVYLTLLAFLVMGALVGWYAGSGA